MRLGQACCCNRRKLLATGAWAMLTLPVAAHARLAGLVQPLPGGPVSVPVLTFFADRPMIDPTASLPPWRPPSGYRGANAMADVDEETWRRFAPFH